MKVALCLRGAVSKNLFPFHSKEEYINRAGNYINFKACYNSIIKHIVSFNKHCKFDFYIHCWSHDLENELTSLYQPKKYIFEDNLTYFNEISEKIINAKDFSVVSQSLSQYKCLSLIEEDYDYIIIYRPDLLLWKDIDLLKYDNNNVYVNAHPNLEGDFHFIMNMTNALKFKNLYKSINSITLPPIPHKFIKNYVINHMKCNFIMDDIEPGKHQEVIRKINFTSIKDLKIPIENFFEYGLTKEEILTYNSP